jgi:hypothetical protein
MPAAARVDALRRHLSTYVQEYSTSFSQQPIPPTPAGSARSGSAVLPEDPGGPQLDELRAELSAETTRAIDEATSSEAQTAIRRAKVESTLELIHTYERALGMDVGAPTTEWNVIPDADLELLHAKTRSNLTSLELEAQRYARAEVPPSLDHRIRELRGYSNALGQEVTARRSGARSRPLQIRAGPSVADARRLHPAIDVAEQRAKVFQAKLRLQIALRSHWAPGDAGLANLERAVSVSARAESGRADSVFKRVQMGTAARPPPPEPRLSQIAEDVRAAAWDELDAVKLRDRLEIAKAHARQNAGTALLRTALGDEAASLTRLSTHTSESLLELRTEYAEWHRHLAAEDVIRSDAVSLRQELEEVRTAIDEINDELRLRHLPCRAEGRIYTPDAIAEARIPADRRAVVAVLERRYPATIAVEEAVQLERQANRIPEIPDTRLPRAQHVATVRALTEEATSLRGAWNRLTELERQILIRERGAAAAEHTAKVTAAKTAVSNARAGLAHDVRKLARVDPRASSAIRDLLDPIRVGSPRGAPSTVAEALLQVERLPAIASSTQQPSVAFFEDPGGPRGSPQVTYVSPPGSTSPQASHSLPEEYSGLFPEGEAWTKNYRDTVGDLRRAPGGIVIDATLPEALARRIERVEVDPSVGTLRLRIDGTWHQLAPGTDAATARAAWAFVRDGRVSAADVRPLALPEVQWLAETYARVPFDQLTANETRTLREDLRLLTSANLNPALAETAIGVDLIVADLVIFDLLPASALALEGDSTRFGLDASGLWQAFKKDREQILIDPAHREKAFSKSLLVIKQVSALLRAGLLVVSAQIEPGLFAIPLEGAQGKPDAMKESTRWLRTRTPLIRQRFPSFERVARFAAVTALFKTIEQRRIPHNLDILVGVSTVSTSTPRIFCRSADLQRCDRNKLAHGFGSDRHGTR